MTTDVESGTAARRYPFSEARALDVDPTYRGLRDDEPMSRIQAPHGGECWLAVRHADVRTVLSDPRFSRAATVGADVARPRPEIDRQSSSILNMDPPEHTRAAQARRPRVHHPPGRRPAPAHRRADP